MRDSAVHKTVPCPVGRRASAESRMVCVRYVSLALPTPQSFLICNSEMSYGIMGSTRNSHMLTYQTTRRIQCIYFDGESATLFGSGQLDTQMLQIWGNLSGPARPDNGWRGLWEEY